MRDDAAFSATVIEQDGGVSVLVRGDVDLATAAALSEAIDDASTRGRGSVVVDLSGSPFIDSSGISALVRAAQLAEGRAAVTVRSPTPQARRVFLLTGVDQFLIIEN